MHEIENLKQQLCRELDEYAAKGKLDMQSLQIIDTIAHTVKNLNKILEHEEKSNGYSEGPRVHGTYSFANNNSGYNSGYNYNRMPDWRSDSYSMADRYSMGNEAMINKLYDLMNQTRDEKTRHEFQNFIDRMERM